jgi:hypothetical protein
LFAVAGGVAGWCTAVGFERVRREEAGLWLAVGIQHEAVVPPLDGGGVGLLTELAGEGLEDAEVIREAGVFDLEDGIVRGGLVEVCGRGIDVENDVRVVCHEGVQ